MATPKYPMDKETSKTPDCRGIPTAAAVKDGSTLIELCHDPDARTTAFAVWESGSWRLIDRYDLKDGTRIVPYSPKNTLLWNDVVLLPKGPEEYGSEEELLTRVQAFIHRYVDLSERFETIVSWYVLLSWRYDDFNEVPYLRVRGDYGTGKTRFLMVVGSLCYKPIFASGASTVSPLFHMLDAFRGTLILDEADFRFSDEKAEMVKILNNGNMRGMPVLRTEVNRHHEFSPRAFSVFGPKLVASRGHYDDRALESRFLTEDTNHGSLRSDIPISLPKEWVEEGRVLRNQLLLYRFHSLGTARERFDRVDASIEARLNQVFMPLLSIMRNAQDRDDLRALAREYHEGFIADRGFDTEAQLLEVLREHFRHAERPQVALKTITTTFRRRFGGDYERPITNKWIGRILRRQLGLATHKSNGTFAVPLTEFPKIDRLCEKYGVTDPKSTKITAVPIGDAEYVIEPLQDGDIGDVGDVSADVDIEF